MGVVVFFALRLGVFPGLAATFTRRFEGQAEFYRGAPTVVLEGGPALAIGLKMAGFGLAVIAGTALLEWWLQRSDY